MNFENAVLKTVEKHNMLSIGDKVAVGVSGGADSVALLCFLRSIKEKYNLDLHVVHINHMIRGAEAEGDCEFVRALAESFGLPFHFTKVDVRKIAKDQKLSEEACGRQVRYDFFNEIAEKIGGGKIAVAHNKGDSAETVVINLIRGATLSGLKGISKVNGNIIRPLIERDRAEIELYLKEKGQSFVTDSTNGENIYTRNIVRNRIIPAFEEINPNVVSTIYENSLLLSDEDDYISSVTAEFEKRCIEKNDGTVIVSFETPMHIAIKRRLILRAAEILTGSRRNISAVNISSVLSLNTGGRTSFNGIFAERSYDKIIFSKEQAEVEDFSFSLTPPGTFEAGGKTFKFEILSKKEVTEFERNVLYLDADLARPLTVRQRKDGDIFAPLGLGGRKKVKDFLIDLKIPRTVRASLPILEADGKIAAILCIRGDEDFKVGEKTKNILKISEVHKQ